MTMPTDDKRTRMVHLYTPAGGDYRIEVERETVRTYENGDKFAPRSCERIVHRSFPAIANNALPGGPFTITTFAELAAVIAAAADALAAEDEAVDAARLAKLNPNAP